MRGCWDEFEAPKWNRLPAFIADIVVAKSNLLERSGDRRKKDMELEADTIREASTVPKIRSESTIFILLRNKDLSLTGQKLGSHQTSLERAIRESTLILDICQGISLSPNRHILLL